jgi:hypothetical protein
MDTCRLYAYDWDLAIWGVAISVSVSDPSPSSHRQYVMCLARRAGQVALSAAFDPHQIKPHPSCSSPSGSCLRCFQEPAGRIVFRSIPPCAVSPSVWTESAVASLPPSPPCLLPPCISPELQITTANDE